MACEQLSNKVKSLIAERNALQEELKKAAPGQKPPLAGEIKQLNKSIKQAQAELDACFIQAGLQSLVAILSGTATLTTTHTDASGPFTESVTIGLFFSPGRVTFSIVNFPAIATDPFDTSVGTNITTITLDSSKQGTSNPNTGTLTIGCTLKFDHSIDFPFYEEDSTLPIALTTGKIGSLQGAPVNQTTGAVTLVGSGTFQGGFLGGKTGNIVITGTINPIP